MWSQTDSDPLPPEEYNMGTSQKLTLTDRDQKLIDVLKCVRCLGLRQIEQLLHLNGKAYDNRLRFLRRAGYLQKITYGHRGGVYGVVWTAGPKLKKEIKPFSCARLPEINHQLGLSQIYVELFLKVPHLRQYIDWQDGYGHFVLRGEKNLLPDAIVLLRQKNDTVIYLELDRSTKPLERVEMQLKAYRDYLMSPYAKSGEQVWFVTKTRARGKSLLDICRHLSIDTMIAAKIRVFESSMIANELSYAIGATMRDFPLQNNQSTSQSNDLISRRAVKQFIEEAVSMYHEQRLRLPASYKAAAAVLYS